MQHCLMSGNPPIKFTTTIVIRKLITRTVLTTLPKGKNVVNYRVIRSGVSLKQKPSQRLNGNGDVNFYLTSLRYSPSLNMVNLRKKHNYNVLRIMSGMGKGTKTAHNSRLPCRFNSIPTWENSKRNCVY